ncbi:MAG: FAD-binding protein [Armatimonadetes bacterium]|nr:FAD-binding protein [Armatimonadota bacterium]
MNKASLVSRLSKAIGAAYVVHRPEDLVVYERDAFLVGRALPDVVVLPRTTEEVAACVRLARAAGMPIVARGAGTGLNGGSIPIRGGMIVALTRMDRIVEVDAVDRTALVEAGVANAELTSHVAHLGLFFAPDPGSQVASTIGGNIGNNAGGMHCLSYGVTTNHVLACEVVDADGNVFWAGSAATDAPGLDLPGLLCGSEGTIGIVTRAIVRLMRRREAVRTVLAIYRSFDEASRTVSQIVATGILPQAMEMMDEEGVRAVESQYSLGLPADGAAVLLLEVESTASAADRAMNELRAICAAHGAAELRIASNEKERHDLWKARKHFGGALGHLAPSNYVQDGVVPRHQLPAILARIREIGRRHQLRIANVFHAGDGNLHPVILFDPREPGMTEKVVRAGEEILKACVDAGGTVTGEHGVGIEKREYLGWMFDDATLNVMRRLRDRLASRGTMNPDKKLPIGSHEPFSYATAAMLGETST